MDDHLDFIEEAFGEQRADRAVDQAAGQGFQFAGTAFTLEEAARDLAGGIGLFEASVLATTVASTTVSSMLTSTAPDDWRAISPVSIVTWWGPHWKVLVTLLNMLMDESPVNGDALSVAS